MEDRCKQLLSKKDHKNRHTKIETQGLWDLGGFKPKRPLTISLVIDDSKADFRVLNSKLQRMTFPISCKTGNIIKIK
jgi:hypothetical protein